MLLSSLRKVVQGQQATTACITAALLPRAASWGRALVPGHKPPAQPQCQQAVTAHSTVCHIGPDVSSRCAGLFTSRDGMISPWLFCQCCLDQQGGASLLV